MGGGGGSMAGAAGANDHNSRFCHLTFVCRTRGVTHGLAGYFESTLYESQVKETLGKKVEISIHPERIDQKSKDMISWFPIFFPLKVSTHFFPLCILTPILSASVFCATQADIKCHSNLCISLRIRSWKSACGARLTIPGSGTSGLLRHGRGLDPHHALRLARRSCVAAAR